MENNSSHLLETIRRAADAYGMFDAVKRVCCALSGGADSVSLLLALRELAEELNVEIRACHLNHSLRGEESDGDERFCRELCARLEIPLYCERTDVSALVNKHESVEQAARGARYAFFERALASSGENTVLATAHNACDNAETVLLNLSRGTGLAGMCGIPPVRKLGEYTVIRPLILAQRSEIEAYLGEKGQGFVTDKTNFSEDYTRNKIRLRILPELRAINPSLDGTIARMCRLLREDEEYLENLADKALEQTREGRGWNALKLLRTPAPVRARAVRKILQNGGIEPSALRIETAVSLLNKRSARFNPCRDHFFTIRKGIAFTEIIIQHYNH